MAVLCKDTLVMVLEHTLEVTHLTSVGRLRAVCRLWQVTTDEVFARMLRGRLIAKISTGGDPPERVSIKSVIQFMRPDGLCGAGYIQHDAHGKHQMLSVWTPIQPNDTLWISSRSGPHTAWSNEGTHWQFHSAKDVDPGAVVSLIRVHVRLMETVFPELAGLFLPRP